MNLYHIALGSFALVFGGGSLIAWAALRGDRS